MTNYIAFVGHCNGKPKLKTNNGFFIAFAKWEHQQERKDIYIEH